MSSCDLAPQYPTNSQAQAHHHAASIDNRLWAAGPRDIHSQDNSERRLLREMTPAALSPGATPLGFGPTTNKLLQPRFRVSAAQAFPSFLPKQVEIIKDPFARKLATRIERLPVQVKLNSHLFPLSLSLMRFRC